MNHSLKRIEKELKRIYSDEGEELLEEKGIISVGPFDEDDMYEWGAEIIEPEASPYESGTFQLKIKYPKDYPFKPPSIYFLTRIFHVNIHYDGKICCKAIDLLHNSWNPSVSVIDILTEIINLLKFPNFDKCNLFGYPSDLVNRCYKDRDYKYYNKVANEWTIKYADGHCDEFLNNNGNITEYDNKIEELITDYEKELDEVNNFYYQLL